MKTKIEVGANKGTETKELASDGSIVYAFEPTYELLIEYLWPLSYENKNIRILPFAVDSENSFKKFNIAGHWDWGCSSLYEFSDNLNETWPGRVDFLVHTLILYQPSHYMIFVSYTKLKLLTFYTLMHKEMILMF